MNELNNTELPSNATFMKHFYERFYAAVGHSQAHHIFCERVFGKDLNQHGFADVEQLRLIMEVTRMSPRDHVLELGCGTGMIAEYVSDCTGAHITGLDYAPGAIRRAAVRTAAKASRLAFMVGDINCLQLPDQAFDVILSIDSMYFSEDYGSTLRALRKALRPGGQLAMLYSHGREPWVPRENFPRESLAPGKTPLAEALRANTLGFQTWDLTRQDYVLAQRRKEVLAELKPQFEAEGTLFMYENRMGDAQGVIQAVDDGLHARYLYHVQLAEPC